MQKRNTYSPLLSILLLLFSFFYLEVVLRLTAHLDVINEALPGMIFTAAGFSLLVCFFGCLPRNAKTGRIIGLILLELSTVWFLIAYFTDNAYQVFMDASTVIGEAGNVVKGLGDTIVTVVTRGAPLILLYHVPVLLWAVFWKKLTFPHKKRFLKALLVLILAAALLAGGCFLQNRTQTLHAKFTNEYSYDSAVRQFGLLTAAELDIIHIADPAQTEREIVFSEPQNTPVPAEETKEPVQEIPVQTETAPVEPEQPAAEAEPEPVEYGYNVLDIDFETLIAETYDQTLANSYAYVSSLQPSRQNEYTGLFAGKNLILITAESFTAEVIDPVRTPTLYRLANKGIVFEDFYQPAWGGSTTTGEFSFLTGVIPTMTSAIQRTITHHNYFTLGNQLQRQGYFSRAYHNGDLTYYNRHLTHKNLGYSEYIAKGNGMENGIKQLWPASDLEMVQFTLSDYIENQPFSAYYMSISGHCNYRFDENVNSMAVKNQSVVEGMEGSEKVLAYLAANQELENALSYLVGELEKAGIADNTVIAVCADHYPYGLEQSMAWGNGRDYLCELYGCDEINNLTRDHNAAIIWSGCLENRTDPIVVSTPTYSLDLVPTLSNLFGLPYDSRLLIGRDVLSEQEPLVLWMDYSWLTDKGYYNNANGMFTPKDGVEIEEGYVDRIKQTVSNKMALSKAIINYDYYGLLFGPDEDQ